MSDKAARQRRRLLVVTSTFPRWQGDTEPPFVFELCRRLSANFEIWVLAPHAKGAKLQENWDGLQITRFRYFFDPWESLAYQGGILANLKRLPLNYLLVPLFLIFQTGALVRLLSRMRFDAIHAHWLIPQGAVAVWTRMLSRRRIPLLCTSHGSDLLALRGSLFAALQRWIMRRADGLTVVSQAMKDQALLLGADSEKTMVASMGVDAKHVFTPDHSAVRQEAELLYVGRLSAQKGIAHLIRALPDVLAKFPMATMTIVGSGPEEVALRELCGALGLGGKVSFVAAVDQEKLANFYRRATLLVLPSITEGLGLVCAEALACGCPVVASDLPALREIVIDGQTGLLVPPGNSTRLAEEIKLLLADPALRSELAQRGRAMVNERLDWQAVTERYRQCLENLIALGGSEDTWAD